MKNPLYIFLACSLVLMGCADDVSNEGDDLFVKKVDKEFAGAPKGTLFAIGGGKRPADLIKALVESAGDQSGYIMVFSQSSMEPDSSFHYIAKDFAPHPHMTLVHVKGEGLRTSLIDSVRKAPIIFITGGDQNRFLETVHAAVRKAIKEAYYAGSTIGGTSAGAALMSAIMLTGDQRDWPNYESTYSQLNHNNAIYSQGLGLLDSTIIDQHFVTRSRYNRLISALADTGFPSAVGVDEATALVYTAKYCTVVGDNQVVLMKRPKSWRMLNGKIGLGGMEMDIYLKGDTFQLNHEL
jgi:cyanophycinase